MTQTSITEMTHRLVGIHRSPKGPKPESTPPRATRCLLILVNVPRQQRAQTKTRFLLEVVDSSGSVFVCVTDHFREALLSVAWKEGWNMERRVLLCASLANYSSS